MLCRIMPNTLDFVFCFLSFSVFGATKLFRSVADPDHCLDPEDHYPDPYYWPNPDHSPDPYYFPYPNHCHIRIIFWIRIIVVIRLIVLIWLIIRIRLIVRAPFTVRIRNTDKS